MDGYGIRRERQGRDYSLIRIEATEHVIAHLQQRRSTLNSTRKAVVVLPTGTGKTAVALLLPHALRCMRVLVVTPRDTLRSQMYEAATNSHKRLQQPAFLLSIGIIPADREDMLGNVRLANTAHLLFDNISSVSMTVANAAIFTDRRNQTRRSWMRLIPPSTYDLVIVDEAHFHPAPTWENICKHFLQNPACNVVFLTATPFRQDGDRVCESDEFCYQLTRTEAVRRGIIRDVRSIFISFTAADEKAIDDAGVMTDDDDEDDVNEMSDAKQDDDVGLEDYDSGDESEARINQMEQRMKNLSVLREVRRLLLEHDQQYPLPDGRKHKGLVMVNVPSSVAHQLQRDARSQFPDIYARGYYTGTDLRGRKMTKSKLTKILNTFRRLNGEVERDHDPRILIVNNMLREGFDFASVSVVGISRSFDGDGPTFEQFLGRSVRTFREREPRGLTAKFVWHTYDQLGPYFTKYRSDRLVPIAP